MPKPVHNQNFLFKKTRKKLNKLLPNNSLLILHSNDEMPRNGDQNFPYRQDSNFFYFTGINQEKSIFIQYKNDKGNEENILFIIKSNPLLETWHGHRLTPEEATQISGIKTICTLDEFDAKLREFMSEANKVFLNANNCSKSTSKLETKNERFYKEITSIFPKHEYKSAAPLLTQLRLIKEKEEIDIMRDACKITEKAFYHIVRELKPGLNEYEIEAEMTYSFLKDGASSHAYPPIIASGKNACVLHYITNNQICKNGELLLLDFGAEYNNYASDCSRTIPVNGKFNNRQKECYEAVLKVQKKAIKLFKPGNTINIVNQETKKMLEKEMIALGLFTSEDLKTQTKEFELLSKYLMHGVTHFIGLDVHDVGNNDTTFKTGMVLTIEPGIYIPEENIGIRIEDNIIVDETPINLMENIPREVAEIESLFSN